MERIKEVFTSRTVLWILGALILTGGILLVGILFFHREEEETIRYPYSNDERTLADLEKTYLSSVLDLHDAESETIAHEAIEIYRVIAESNTDMINDAHSETIKNRLRRAIISEYEDAQLLSEDDLDAISSGMCEILYEFLLQKAEALEDSEDLSLLLQSLQDQIDDLENKKATIRIRVNGTLDPDTLYEALLGMSDSDLERIAALLGFKDKEDLLNNRESLTAEDLRLIKESLGKDLEKTIETIVKEKTKGVSSGKDGKDGKNGLDGKDGKDGKDGLTGKAGIDGKDGKDGRNGKDGKNGDNGKSAYELAKENGFTGSEEAYLKSLQGLDGRDGEDGLNTYIAYAEDDRGNGFSKTPNNLTRFIGTLLSSEKEAPDDPSLYHWSVYKDYIITYDETSNTVIITD